MGLFKFLTKVSAAIAEEEKRQQENEKKRKEEEKQREMKRKKAYEQELHDLEEMRQIAISKVILVQSKKSI